MWDGIQIPVEHDIEVESDGTIATIAATNDNRTTKFRLHRTDRFWSAPSLKSTPLIGVNRPIYLVSWSAVENQLTIEDDFNSIIGFPDITENVRAPFDAALKLLATHVPHYLDWVERVIRRVLICDCRATRTRSSTWSEAPGTILVSSAHEPLTIAEMLVHEASHQYFHLVSRLGAVSDGVDKKNYYSPAVSRDRPLSRILIAYHAFGNMGLMYRGLREHGASVDDSFLATECRILKDAKQLEVPLANNASLTEIGRSLCVPLMHRISAT